MLRVLFLTNPHLVEAAETAQHAPTHESTVLALHAVRIRQHTHPGVRVHRLNVCLQALRELIDQRAGTGEDDVVKQNGPSVDVHGLQRLVDDRGDGLLAAGLLGLVVGVSGVLVEEALGDLEALKAEDCVPAVGHFERSRGLAFDEVAVGNTGLACGRVEASGALPDLDDAFFEGCKDSVFFVSSEGVGGWLVELGVGGGAGCVGIDRCLRLDHVMWDEGDCGLVVGEHDADLVVQPVAGEWCVLQAWKLLARDGHNTHGQRSLFEASGADSLFVSTMPSHSAVTDVFSAPMSTTRAVALLCEYLQFAR
jgi:hypothetical protein